MNHLNRIGICLILLSVSGQAWACGGFASQAIRLGDDFEDHGVKLRVLSEFSIEISSYNYKTGKFDPRVFTYDRLIKDKNGRFSGAWCEQGSVAKPVKREWGSAESSEKYDGCPDGVKPLETGPLVSASGNNASFQFEVSGREFKILKVGQSDPYYAITASKLGGLPDKGVTEGYMVVDRMAMPPKSNYSGGLGNLLNTFAEPKPVSTLWLKSSMSFTEDGHIGARSRGGSTPDKADGFDMTADDNSGEFEIGCGGLRKKGDALRAVKPSQNTDAL